MKKDIIEIEVSETPVKKEIENAIIPLNESDLLEALEDLNSEPPPSNPRRNPSQYTQKRSFNFNDNKSSWKYKKNPSGNTNTRYDPRERYIKPRFL